MQPAILLDNYVCKFCFRFIELLSKYNGWFNVRDLSSTSTQLIVAAGIGPVIAIKYFRYTYRPSQINKLQQIERSGGPIITLGTIESQTRPVEKDVTPLSISQPKNRNPVFEPLLSDSPSSARRSLGSATPFEFFQSPSRLSLNYSRNCKDN